MNALVAYLDSINARRALFGREPYDAYRDYVEVRTEVEALGSPEILSKNGTLSIDETAERTNEWLDAMQELIWIGEELMA